MWHRAFTGLSLLSAVAFVVAVAVVTRQRFAADHVHVIGWWPSVGRYAEVEVWSCGGLCAHAEFGRAASAADGAVLRALTGPSGLDVSRTVEPPQAWDDRPNFWVDHYRSAPYVGINQRSVVDSWNLEVRAPVVLAAFSVLPVLWSVARVRRHYRRRRATARGFPVLPEAKPAMPAR